MQIKCLKHTGTTEALLGLGLSYGLTSEYECWEEVPREVQERVKSVAQKLAGKGGGEDKFCRMVQYWWSVKAPRYLWQEIDQYRIGVTTQSESTMHTLMHRDLVQEDFEDEVYKATLFNINQLIKIYRETKSEEAFLQVKNILPEGFLQRRVWNLSLAQMFNIYQQRKSHRLPQWRQICDAFVENTPHLFRGMFE